MSVVTFEKNRVLGLDIVRSIAILLVVYTHAIAFIPKGIWRFYYLLPRPGIDGVSIFFVLSGFLIGTILLKIIDKSDFTHRVLLNFWIRRWFRTLPNYFLILLILIIYQVTVIGNMGDFNLKYLIFSQNLFHAHPEFFSEAWSLSVEEWFYLSFPVVCFFMMKVLKDKKRTIILAAVSFIIIPLVIRIVSVSMGIGLSSWDENYRKVVIFRLDSVMYGIVGAYVAFYFNSTWEKFSKTGLVLSLILILFLTFRNRLGIKDIWFFAVYGFNLESLATLFMLPFFSMLKTIKFRIFARFFTFISIISYSMYLINYTIVLKILMPFSLSALGLLDGSKLPAILVSYFLFWTFVIGGSYLLYTCFERPVMNLRDRINFK